jgi:hypothetical protein
MVQSEKIARVPVIELLQVFKPKTGLKNWTVHRNYRQSCQRSITPKGFATSSLGWWKKPSRRFNGRLS